MRLLAGAGSGAFTKTAVAPLERIKILFQVEGMSNEPRRYTSILQSIRRVVAEEGVVGLYRGNLANVVRVVPTYGFKFAFNDWFKDLVAPGVQKPTTMQLMLSGTLAGLSQLVISYPLELIRTRMAVGTSLYPPLVYKGIVDCAVTVVRVEGVRGLFKGITATLAMGAPFVGLQMTSFAEALALMPRQADGTVALPFMLLAGAASGTFAQSVMYPGDTIRRLMQTNGADGRERAYSTTLDCCRKVFARQGIRGFYRGFYVNLVRAVPGASIQFAGYEFLKNLLGVGGGSVSVSAG